MKQKKGSFGVLKEILKHIGFSEKEEISMLLQGLTWRKLTVNQTYNTVSERLSPNSAVWIEKPMSDGGDLITHHLLRKPSEISSSLYPNNTNACGRAAIHSHPQVFKKLPVVEIRADWCSNVCKPLQEDDGGRLQTCGCWETVGGGL